MGVQVAGFQGESAGGLLESLAAHHKNTKETSDILLNLSGIGTATGQKVHKDTPRPNYVHQKLPRMLYHPQHGEKIVYTEQEMHDTKRAGYREEPYVKPQVAIHDPATEKKQLIERNQELEGKLAQQNDILLKMQDQFEALTKRQSELEDSLSAPEPKKK